MGRKGNAQLDENVQIRNSCARSNSAQEARLGNYFYLVWTNEISIQNIENVIKGPVRLVAMSFI